MRKQNDFVYLAKELKQYRNKFRMPHTLKTSFNHGLCIPFKVYEVIPGDTFKMNVASLIRMSTPIAPIMDNITMHLAAYFVPSRLVYEHFEEVMGANKTGAWWDDEAEYSIPTFKIENQILSQTIGDYMGAPGQAGDSKLEISTLPFRAYYLIWNEYYRSQVVSAPYAIDMSSNKRILVHSNPAIKTDTDIRAEPLPLGKYADMFTKCLPEPQKGPEIKIPGTEFAWLDTTDTLKSFTNSEGAKFGHINEDNFIEFESAVLATNGSGKMIGSSTDIDSMGVVTGTSLGIKLKEALGNINSLRFAFQLQKFFEKDARYGTRFFEMLNGHYGVTNPDATLQRPQLLGEINWRINVDQVLSTSGYSNTSSTTVGAPGANSVTAGKGGLFTASFTEPGYIIIVGGTRHDHTYGQSLNKLWTKKDRLDFYNPLFANIGEQPVMDYEIDLVNGTGQVFGYQEAWVEHRIEPDMVTGILNPYRTGSLDYWTLADKFDDAPVLNEEFIYENRDSIKRALVTGENGPDYIADFFFDLTAVRELPLYSIPGLADHH